MQWLFWVLICVLALDIARHMVSSHHMVSRHTANIAALAFSRLATVSAHERSIKLLRSWLTPEQREQYDHGREFTVIGGDTGTEYRLLGCCEVYNICTREWRYCVVPEGTYTRGDMLLAQKIALERDETATLAIANVTPASFIPYRGTPT